MKIIKKINEWKKIRHKMSNTTIGFVPTMGNLHEGHVSLLLRSRRENKCSILSIFINPTQFNDNKDFENYPQTLEKDLLIANQVGVDYILLPTASELYPDEFTYRINETKFSQEMEGAFRPGHFEGMLTIVLKLLLLTKPNRAYFGEKDFQQLQLVKGMTKAFFLETDIIACPTIRTNFGLPLSSRNNRLSSQQFEKAKKFPEIFHSTQSCSEIAKQLENNGFIVDYVVEYQNRKLAAVRLDEIRLIDNVLIGCKDYANTSSKIKNFSRNINK